MSPNIFRMPFTIISNLINIFSYNNPRFNNDIGLIKTREKIQFNERVQPIAISKDGAPDGTMVTLTGWGRLSAWGAIPNNLHKINLKTISFDDCFRIHGGTSDVSRGHVCTFTQIGEGACNGK